MTVPKRTDPLPTPTVFRKVVSGDHGHVDMPVPIVNIRQVLCMGYFSAARTPCKEKILKYTDVRGVSGGPSIRPPDAETRQSLGRLPFSD